VEITDRLPEGGGMNSTGAGIAGSGLRLDATLPSWKIRILSLRDRVIEQPFLFYALWRSRENEIFEKRVVRPTSAIVIEGFPRCGNTFAYYAFALAQEKTLHIGNHMHCVSQFHLARRWKVPALLVVRSPRSTIASNYIYNASLPLGFHIQKYVDFHTNARRYADSLIVSDFPQTTTAFGGIVSRVNDRFGTRFKGLENTAERQQSVMDAMHKINEWRRTVHPVQVQEHHFSFPTDEKNKMKAVVEEMMSDRKYANLLQQAEDAYRALL
jgi:hypothetical protein